MFGFYLFELINFYLFYFVVFRRKFDPRSWFLSYHFIQQQFMVLHLKLRQSIRQNLEERDKGKTCTLKEVMCA